MMKKSRERNLTMKVLNITTDASAEAAVVEAEAAEVAGVVSAILPTRWLT